MEELKPCPFCGGEAEIVMHKGYGRPVFTVRCSSYPDDCEIHPETGIHYDEEEAIEAWNRRGDHPAAAPDTPARFKCNSCVYYQKDTSFCVLGEDFTGPECPACSDFQDYVPKEGATADG